MGNGRGRRVAYGLAWALIVCAAGPALAAEKELFVQWGGRFGDKLEPIWVAHITTERGAERTTVLVREEFGVKEYKQLPPFMARAIGVTSDSTEMVLLLADRRWLWLSPIRSSYGPLLPDQEVGAGLMEDMRIITLAGDRKSLWALGAPNLNSPPHATSAPASAPAETRPATRPAEPSVYLLAGDKWKRHPAPWPAGTTPSQREQVSMAVVGETPCIAIPRGEQELAVYRLSRDGRQWESIGSAKIEKPIERFKVLDLGGSPGVWIYGEGGMGLIWTEARQIALPLDGAAPRAADVDVAAAGPVIRAMFVREKKVFEQRYSLDGAAEGAPTPLTIVPQSTSPPFNWPITLTMAAVAALIVVTLLRRRDMAENGDEER